MFFPNAKKNTLSFASQKNSKFAALSLTMKWLFFEVCLLWLNWLLIRTPILWQADNFNNNKKIFKFFFKNAFSNFTLSFLIKFISLPIFTCSRLAFYSFTEADNLLIRYLSNAYISIYDKWRILCALLG